MPYQIPAREIQSEITVVNSKFIATLTPVFTVDEAKAFIQRIRGEFSDATHNVPAYIIGHSSSVIKHSSDDGEPNGTAGKPVLAALTGSNLGDVAIVVTRYFGGTKLGTGGLVRAYTQSAKSVIDLVPRAVKIQTYTVMLGIPYKHLERVRLSIKEIHGDIIDEVFGGEVTISARMPVDQLANLQSIVNDISRGEADIMIIEKKESIFPIEE